MKMPKEFQLIKQPPNSKVCGAACCAMATGRSLESILQEYDWREATHVVGMANILAQHGITMGLYIIGEGGLESMSLSIDPNGSPAVVAVKSAIFKNADHWVFWDGSRILDPSQREQERYEVLEVWYLTYWPEPDEELPIDYYY